MLYTAIRRLHNGEGGILVRICKLHIESSCQIACFNFRATTRSSILILVASVQPCTHLDLVVAAEPVKLIEQLKHGPLHLPVSRLLSSKPLRPDRIQFVDEDDRTTLEGKGMNKKNGQDKQSSITNRACALW